LIGIDTPSREIIQNPQDTASSCSGEICPSRIENKTA